MTGSIDPGALLSHFEAAHAHLERLDAADALWKRRLDVWSADPAVQQKVANRLGWLTSIEFVEARIAEIESVAAAVRNDGFTDVVLLGMGGSSLAPEVIRQVIGVFPGYPRFRMLDSTDPDAVRAAMANAEHSLFVFASKSGSTIEPNVMAAEARRRVEAAGFAWGSRFIAITDPDTELHQRAREASFRHIFVNPPDIGGRYSALSLFGMVPAALMGIPLAPLLAGAKSMAEACRVSDSRQNPGLALGVVMGASAEAGRNKLTLVVPDKLASLGLWVEQLVAESTGKQGKGVAPIAGEPPLLHYGEDRAATLTLSAAAVSRLGKPAADKFLRVIERGDYAAILAFFPEDAAVSRTFDLIRAGLGNRTWAASMFGYGPRYLHSTGQLHKGGPPNGVFVIVVAEPKEDLAIPGEPFSFGILEKAQAFGDFASLDAEGRRALLIRLPSADPVAADAVFQKLLHEL